MSAAQEKQFGAIPRVLVIDDEPDIRELLELTLLRMGLDVDAAGSVAEARSRLDKQRYQLCLTDMRLPDGEGLEVIQHIGQHCRDLPVAVITAYGSMESAVAALKAGAFDYLNKPIALDNLRALVKSALAVPSAKPRKSQDAQGLMGESPPLRQVKDMIVRLGGSMAPVAITGESGSGKERAAKLIHAHSARAEQAFIAVNCGAIPETLMESEFFGYRKGAFTGADNDRDGFFQAADGGTLFLDEVADLPLSMQVKLLRAIQEKRVRRVGGTQEEAVDVRIISATHQNLRQRVEEGRFRQDLYYRLNVIELKMPALRECAEDIPFLAGKLLERLAVDSGVTAPRLSETALEALRSYPFPGNVRELENTLERALALCSHGLIQVEDLRLVPADMTAELAPGMLPEEGMPLQDYLDNVERKVILDALAQTGFNRTAAAKLLGVTFRSLRYRLERLGITEP